MDEVESSGTTLGAPIHEAALRAAAERVQALSANPEWFLDPSAEDAKHAAASVRSFVKLFFDGAQSYCPPPAGNDAADDVGGIVVDGFDREQIWEEMEVQNIPFRRHLRHRLSRLVKAPADAVDLSIATSTPSTSAVSSRPPKEPSSSRAKTMGKVASSSAAVAGESKPKPEKGSLKRSGRAERGTKPDGEAGGAKHKAGGEGEFFSYDEFDKFADMADAKIRLDPDADDSDFDLLEGGDGDEGDEAAAKGAMFSDFFLDEPAGAEATSSAKGKSKAAFNDDRGMQEEGEDGDEGEESEGGFEGGDAEDLSDEERELENKIRDLQKQDRKSSSKKKRRGEADDEDEEDGEGDEDDEEKEDGDDGERRGKTLYEMDRRLQSLEDEVAKLEEEQLAEAKWSMKGEVNARQRPLNSLLEVHLDQPMSSFAGRRAEDAAAVALNGSGGAENAEEGLLEDVAGGDAVAKHAHFDVDAVIRQRIWDEAFDDVVRKADLPPSQRPRVEGEDVVETLNFEKSRVGLGDIYAKQYEAQLLGHKTDGEVKDDKEKAETKALFAKLMYKLDQLTNAHFTPKPPTLGFSGADLAKVPSIKMEETIPLMMSQSTLKAPEELKAPRRHEREQAELDHEERGAVRRAKKVKRHKVMERRVVDGAMTLGTLRQREKDLGAKNQAAKEERAAKALGKPKEQKKRLKASELLEQAAKTASGGASRKEEARKERQQRPEGAPTSKKLKL
mmetsp:Transcript_56705/g.183691  ORF Transcript_56705/g.183691 Transcript_56705/m.183691 type:complete len:730 (+) Transcript_56705:88-2277(+)